MFVSGTYPSPIEYRYASSTRVTVINNVIDGRIAALPRFGAKTAGGWLRYVQTGRAQNYLLAIALGVIIVLAAGLLR